MNGRIKNLAKDKGYGFISSENGDYFFHYSAVINDEFNELQANDKVTFEPTTTAKGKRAEAVTLAR